MPGWMNESGGIRYHLRAARYAGSLWAPFRQAVGGWLREWPVNGIAGRELILIGPSAGYCLDRSLIERFGAVICVDPDPVARVLFNWRTGLRPVRWIRDDFFTTHSEERARFDGLRALLQQYPKAAVLFCNFLGQLRLLLDERVEDELLASWKRELIGMLEGRPWASFHDRFSGRIKPALAPGTAVRFECRPDDEKLLARCYAPGMTGELFDHCTDGFFPRELSHAYFFWELLPGCWHLIEAVRVNDPK